MAIFKSKNFKTDFQCEKLKTTKILRQRWDLKTASGVIFFFFFKDYITSCSCWKEKRAKKPDTAFVCFF